MVRRVLILVCSLLGWSPAGHATLLPIDDVTFGKGALTLDTQTGLRFLDLTITRNASFAQVSAQLAAGSRYAGYRYATLPEVLSLFADAGLAVTTSARYSISEFSAGEGLLSLLGPLYSSAGNLALTAGLTGTLAGVGMVDTVSLTDCYTTAAVCIATSVPADSTDAEAGTYSTTRGYTYLGSFLVAVPQVVAEPSSFGVLGFAVAGAGLMAAGRRRFCRE